MPDESREMQNPMNLVRVSGSSIAQWPFSPMLSNPDNRRLHKISLLLRLVRAAFDPFRAQGLPRVLRDWKPTRAGIKTFLQDYIPTIKPDQCTILSSGARRHEDRKRGECIPEALLLPEVSSGTPRGLLGTTTEESTVAGTSAPQRDRGWPLPRDPHRAVPGHQDLGSGQ